MKKILVVALSLALTVGALTACGNTNNTTNNSANTAENAVVENTTTEDTTEVAEETVATAKTGLAVLQSVAKSKDAAADAEGLGEVDSTIVAVLVAEDGTIIDCKIDMAQTKINFSTAGVVTTALDTVQQSKQELGEAYGMKAASAIGKEWNEQADAFAAYVIGKTADEVAGIAVSEDGHAGDADLLASVSVHVSDFINGVVKACANAQDLGASATDSLGYAVSTAIDGSKDAAADADGLAQAYSTYAVLTVNADGVITSCFVDMSQGKINFNTSGVITTDLTVTQMTKQELGDGYGMKAASAIGLEWFEQANAFSAYVTGKTAADVSGFAVSEDGHAADADLVSSVTVHIAPFISIVEKAVANAQ